MGKQISRCNNLFSLALIVFLFCLQHVNVFGVQEKDIRMMFEKEYEAWRKYCSDNKLIFMSDLPVAFKFQRSEYHKRIVNLGIESLPIIIEKLEEELQKPDINTPPVLHLVLHKITKVNLHIERREKQPNEFIYIFSEFPEIEEKDISDAIPKLWLRWWHEGRLQTPQRFNQLFTDWKTFRKQGKTKEADEKYQRIKDLGIDALPSIMQKIEQGDKDLIPIVSYLTDGAVAEVTKPSEVINWWNNNKDKWTLPPVE